MSEIKYKKSSSTIIFSDYPDPDIIKVNDTYYMISTTMHFFPGCPILRSYNLLDWEIVSYVFNELDSTCGQQLEALNSIYGQGMWAGTIRYYNGTFYIAFSANDTHKTYLYTSESVYGPWKKSTINGFYHDMSLLFDDDGRVFCISGNNKITLIELEKDLSGPKKDGVNKIIIEDKDSVILAYEGSHFYKINNKYYIFLIHWPKDKLRTQACFVSDNIEGPYVGRDVFSADYKNWNSGLAQGGIVQGADNKWYSILFQDHGALGRMPVLLPVYFNEEAFPVFGECKNTKLDKILSESVENRYAPEELSLPDLKSHKYEVLYTDDLFLYKEKPDHTYELKKPWQWNHEPDFSLISFDSNLGGMEIKTDKLTYTPLLSKNILTQRAFTHNSCASIFVNGCNLNNGDYAGLIALEGDYAFIALHKKEDSYYLVQGNRKSEVEAYKIGSIDKQSPEIIEEIKLDRAEVQLKISLCFETNKEEARFYYFDIESSSFIEFPFIKKVRFTLDQFVGCRYGIFIYSTEQTGGKALFKDFQYKIL